MIRVKKAINPIKYLSGLLLVVINLFIISGTAAALPNIYSKFYCLIDGDTGQVLASQNGDQKRPVASTTKMMTAILAVEYCDLNEIAIVSSHADRTPEFTIGLKTGQKISIEDLLKVTLLSSSNDAAVVIAEHVAGDEQLFGHLMSLKALAIGAMNTHFVNASGLPADNHYSSAYDLGQIGRYLLNKPYINKLVNTKQTTFKHPGYTQPLTISNTNALLGSYPGANGIKTGTTDAAGKCLVASAKRDKRQLIAVVLKSGDRNGDCIRLLNYGFNSCYPSKIVDKNQVFKSINVLRGEESKVTITADRDLWLLQADKSPNIEKKVKMDYEIPAPIVKGQKIGCIEIYADGKYYDTVNLICGQDIKEEPNLISKLVRDHILN